MTKRRTTIYTNRANPYVINRMLETGRKRRVDYLKRRREQLRLQLDTKVSIPTDKTHSLVCAHLARKTRDETERLLAVNDILLGMVGWDDCVNQLKNREDYSVSRLVIATRLVERPDETFHVDPDICTDCLTTLSFDNVTHVTYCTTCGKSAQVLFVQEDTSQDVLVTKQPTIGKNNSIQPHPVDYTYMRTPLYRRYIAQFSEKVPEIPVAVMTTLYRYLSNIHLQNSMRCRPTPVSNILRSNGLPEWAGHSIRISKIFNGEPVPIIPCQLVDRLVLRFERIFRHSSSSNRKLPSFEFLTNIMLRIEGRNDLAQSFALHKTATVLRRVFNDLVTIISDIPVTDDILWTPLPHI